MHRWILRAALVLCVAVSASAEDVVTVKSPDGRIEFRLLNGPPPSDDTRLPQLTYEVDYDGKPLLLRSYLGFEISNQLRLGHKLGLINTIPGVYDETFTLPGEKTKTVHYNEIVADYLQDGSLGRRMTMEVRAFNSGVAFRYVVPPSPPIMEMLTDSEMTEFHFARDGQAFPLMLSNFQTAYRDQYTRRTLSTIAEDGLVGLPLLVEQPGVAWVGVTEADLDDFGGLYLARTDRTTLHARISPLVDGSLLVARNKTPAVTPWRVLLIGDRPEQLLESDIITSLNLPSKIADASWIRPGKIVRTLDASATRATIDFAASAGLEYVLAPSASQEILNYATQRKVGLWLSEDWRIVESEMETSFPRWAGQGIRGVRVEGWMREDQDAVALLHKIAATAAEHKLMLAIGGGYKPDGIARVYPNVLTVEAAITADAAKVSAAANPDHEVLLAYTRLLAGPLDYGLGGFNNVTPVDFAPRDPLPMTLGTRAHQLALYVLFASPLQAVNGDLQSYANQRDFDFIKAVPTTWDATRAVAGEAGEYIAVARSHANEWFLGAITNHSAREFDVPLSFLGSGAYTAEIYRDTTEPKRTSQEQRRVTATQSLHLKLAPGGGAAIRFRPAN